MIFKARLDKMAKWITAGIAVLFLLNIFLLVPALEHGQYLLFSGIVLLLTSIYAGTYFFRAKGYELTTGELIIRRPLRDKVLVRADIVNVECLEEGAINRSIRLFGTGGLFGYYGKFSNSKFGAMTWYATNRARPVLLHLRSGKRILITPEEREAFITELSLPAKPRHGTILRHA